MLREDAESLIRTDDTTVPLLAKDKTRTGRLWTYVRRSHPLAVTRTSCGSHRDARQPLATWLPSSNGESRFSSPLRPVLNEATSQANTSVKGTPVEETRQQNKPK